MTLREAEDIARECVNNANNPNPALLRKAAEAIEYLLKELDDAEGYAEWLEFKPD